MAHIAHRLVYMIVVSAALAAVCDGQSSGSGVFAVTRTLKVGGGGGWDYVRLDDQGRLLYLPRTTHTLVVDAESGKTIADIPGCKRNHGVALVPAVGRGFISDGGDGVIEVFDLKTYEVLGKIKAADDADGIIYDAASDRVLVACGDAGVLIPIKPDVDPKSGQADPPIDLGGKPEYLVSDGQGKVYVNIADRHELAAVDTKSMKVISRWPTAPGRQPTGLSMDPATHRLFVGCRNQKLIVMSAEDGHVLADLPIGPGVDATAFYDGLALASCVDGTLAVVRETSPGNFAVVQTVKTAPGAKTMALDPKTGKIYLATADLQPPPADRPRARPQPVPGTFKVIVVERGL